MSTEVRTRNGQVVAQRFSGGAVGVVVQMEVNEVEWAAWAAVEVAEEAREDWQSFASWVEAQHATVRWDSAARQNAMARAFETHRFFGVVESVAVAAMRCRQRARVMARDSMRAV